VGVCWTRCPCPTFVCRIAVSHGSYLPNTVLTRHVSLYPIDHFRVSSPLSTIMFAREANFCYQTPSPDCIQSPICDILRLSDLSAVYLSAPPLPASWYFSVIVITIVMGCLPKSGLDQSKTPFSQRKPVFSIRFLLIGVPYHSEYLDGAA
jgi:hypothetical protein